MKKNYFIILGCIFVASVARAGDAWCKVSVTASENVGYCVEGMDGTGKCLVSSVEGAPRCSDDQPDETPSFAL